MGSSMGEVFMKSGGIMSCEERYEVAMSMPCVSAWRRYPCGMLWLCAEMEGKGRDVGDCTSIDVRHHRDQCASPLRSERRLGGRKRYLVVVDGFFGWVR
jgi:hypothetical protein